MGEGSSPAVFGGRWQVVRRLARGGMGVVYVASDLVKGEQVALKVLYDKEHDFRGAGHERFVREATASEEIGHPGLVRTLDAGVEPDGTRYLVMELLEGQSLRERMKEGLSRRRGLELVLDLLEPLTAAHDKGFIHRDLKPQNALVVRDGDGKERVKLLDFGISRRPGVQTVTDFATGMGTPHYAAPEQMQNARAVTSAADVWSTGVLLYRILTGRLPFEGDAVQMVIGAWEDPHVPVHTRVPGIDGRLSALVDRCLAKAPEERPRDAGELRAQLAALLADGSLALPEADGVEDPTAAASVAQTLPTEGTTQKGDPPTATDPSTAPQPPAVVEVGAEAPPSTSAQSTARPETGLRSLPPPPPAPPPPPPVAPELTPRPRRRRARRPASRAWAPVAAAGAVLLLGSGAIALWRLQRPRTATLRSVQLAPAVAPPAARAANGPAPKPPEGADGAEPTSGKDAAADAVQRTILEEIVLGPVSPVDPNADSRARRRARELNTCLPISDAVHARCFLRALGDRAHGEFELRNLVAAALLTGDEGKAAEAARRYSQEHPRSRYAPQIRQIEERFRARPAGHAGFTQP